MQQSDAAWAISVRLTLQTFSFHALRYLDPIAEFADICGMHGFMTFPTLAAALRSGFQVYNRTPEGYVVRARVRDGWTIAFVAR